MLCKNRKNGKTLPKITPMKIQMISSTSPSKIPRLVQVVLVETQMERREGEEKEVELEINSSAKNEMRNSDSVVRRDSVRAVMPFRVEISVALIMVDAVVEGVVLAEEEGEGEEEWEVEEERKRVLREGQGEGRRGWERVGGRKSNSLLLCSSLSLYACICH